jgi:2-methylisocitrate lyase-like PEP mutase family enzyme
MNIQAQADKARLFRQMHDRSKILLLPNAWDAASARVFARSGVAAIGTTSGGVAWTLGYADGEQAPLADVLAATARIADAVDLPVTADIEGGYGTTPEAVGDTVRAFIETGVVGVNIEDGLRAPDLLRDVDDAAVRIRAARAAADRCGVPIVINARADTYMRQVGDDAAARFDETVRRAKAYLAAGADCIYPIGLSDAATLGALVRALDAPVNVAARPGLPTMAELARLGVARVSTATRLVTLALSAADTALRRLRDTGHFDGLESALSHPDIQHLFDKT